jgi:hypothetical protein
VTPARLRFAALSAAQVLTSAKSFQNNPVLGNPRLNRWGLHAARVELAYLLNRARRRTLAGALESEERRALDRDGFVVCRDFLPAGAFARLRDEVQEHRARGRERFEGDTLLRKITIDAALLAAAPALRQLVEQPRFRALLNYVEGRCSPPALYLQSVLQRARKAAPDPQCSLHRDTFHPTAKAWLYLTDVPVESGPLVYVPGSHVLTQQRLAWEARQSITATAGPEGRALGSSFRVDPAELGALGYAAPAALAVPANTLLVADTFGFHARGRSAGRAQRVEVWAIGRRSPFLPVWADQLLQRLDERRPTMHWRHQEQLAAFDADQ